MAEVQVVQQGDLLGYRNASVWPRSRAEMVKQQVTLAWQSEL